MYLIDTNVISEMRKGKKANLGVQTFFEDVISNDIPTYLSWYKNESYPKVGSV